MKPHQVGSIFMNVCWICIACSYYCEVDIREENPLIFAVFAGEKVEPKTY